MKNTLALLRKYYQISVVLWVILVGLGLYFGGRHTAARWLLSIVALLACLSPLRAQWLELRSGRYGLNVLPPIAIVTAAIIGQYWTAIVLALVIVGTKVLEDYAKHRATAELNGLLTGAPHTAHVLRGRKTIDTAVADVQKNYKLTIEPGEIVPVDAVILDGTSSFDESLLTGDNLPQKKTAQDFIMSGSINLDNSIKVKALDNAAHGTYGRAVKMLRTASTSAVHAPLTRRAEAYTIPFTAAALGIAVAAWVLSDVGHFLGVLAVGTTVPLLTAASLALVSGANLTARFGIFIKTGKVFEQLARTRTMAFEYTSGANYPTKSSLTQLKELGIPNILAITDNDTAATQKAARQLGATDVRVAQSSGDKLRVIEQTTARPVTFVGIDAPVLTAASVDIALGTHSATSSESANVIIMRDDPQLVTTSMAIAKRTLRIARQSIWVGTVLSLALMVLFSTGFVPALAGAIIQGVLNVLAILYALRAHLVNIRLV